MRNWIYPVEGVLTEKLTDVDFEVKLHHLCELYIIIVLYLVQKLVL